MIKEHRSQNRAPTKLNIRLYQNETFQTLARTQDITESGMFIHTDALLFPKDTQIDIVFNDPQSGKSYRVNAKVVHRSLKGIGVQFQHPATTEDDIVFRHLLDCSKVVA